MTNQDYNQRLDEILDSVWNEACDMMEDGGTADVSRTEAKQAITLLIKELVVEAKPKTMPSNLSPENYERCERVVNQYHQNLLKGLEEV